MEKAASNTPAPNTAPSNTPAPNVTPSNTASPNTAAPKSPNTAAPNAPASPAQASAPHRRVTARRGRTRQRLLDAALEVFAEEGFGRSTVERVCDRAGYTRGAFYSNFSSLDELFLAMWEQRSRQMLDDLRQALASAPYADPAEALRAALVAIPVDDAWYRVTAEFTAHALRNPALRRVMAAREQAILDTILPVVTGALARAGRRATDESALGHALVAVHDGTTVQVLLEPDSEAVRRRREELLWNVLRAYSTPEGCPPEADAPEAGTQEPDSTREPNL